LRWSTRSARRLRCARSAVRLRSSGCSAVILGGCGRTARRLRCGWSADRLRGGGRSARRTRALPPHEDRQWNDCDAEPNQTSDTKGRNPPWLGNRYHHGTPDCPDLRPFQRRQVYPRTGGPNRPLPNACKEFTRFLIVTLQPGPAKQTLAQCLPLATSRMGNSARATQKTSAST
jgi:hypothetical protein